jgi:transcription initiation factor TFIID subunit 5
MDDTNESMDGFSDQFPPDMVDVLGFLRNHNMKETETCFRRECHSLINKISSSNEHQYLRNSTNVNDYFAVYSYLSNFIFNSPYQIELIQFLFPLFVHLYLDLIEYNYIQECQYFYNQFVHSTFQSLHSEFFYQLKLISQSSKHLYQCPLTNAFRTSRFFLRLSMTSCTELQTFIDYTKNSTKFNSPFDLTSSQMSLLLSIFHQYLKIDINQQLFTPSKIVRFQTIEQPMTPIFVHTTLANKIQFTRLYTGIFPLQTSSIDSNRLSSHEMSPINRRDLSLSYPRINYNIDLNRLGPHQLPSICLFTLKTKQIINCMVLSNDCQLLAIGFQSSEILICSLNPTKKLYSMKSMKELRSLLSNHHHHHHQDNIFDTTSSIKISNEQILIGHTAGIFALAFEPTKQIYLLSGSQDCTLRLWHLATWSCLVVYKIHCQPILNGNGSIIINN